MTAPGDPLDVVESVLQLLQHGRRTSTYKHAVLMGLMDLCLERTGPGGLPPSVVTTRQLADKVVQLYWPQVAEWSDGGVLRQNRGGSAAILARIGALRERATPRLGAGASAARARLALAAEYEELVRFVEWKLIEMPLPKLQRLGQRETGWLYAIGWDDGPRAPSLSAVRAYQAGCAGAGFDNRIHLREHVAAAFVRLHGVLRPFVEQQWAHDVASLNKLPEDRLAGFLFGADRRSLRPVREPMLRLQGGRCFYCDGAVAEAAAEVDHFIPWARLRGDDLHNLVVAHRRCNGRKSDHLAALEHLRRWRQRNDAHAPTLAEIAAEARVPEGAGPVLGAARGVYLRLPERAPLWSQGSTFVPAEPTAIRAALA